MGDQGLKPGAGEIVLYVIGGACLIYVVWKGYIDGYYASEAGGLFAAAVIAALALLVASRLASQRRKVNVEKADRSKGVE